MENSSTQGMSEVLKKLRGMGTGNGNESSSGGEGEFEFELSRFITFEKELTSLLRLCKALHL